MTEQPLVSIIIPTYNRAHLIGETLDSVLAQTYQKWECIVVDDGSTDDTDEVMANYMAKDSRFRYYHRPKDRLPGGNAARNYGFEQSRGEYIQWFDSDDLMLENFLEFKISQFQKQIVMVITSGYETSADLTKKKQIDLNLKTSLFSQYATWNLHVLSPGIIFKKKFLNNYNGFNENIIRGQETEFFSSLFFRLPNHKFRMTNEPLFLYRKHEDTKTQQNKRYIPDFKFSQIYVCLANLKRAVLINDREVFYYHYAALINFFFSALRYKDKKNAKYVLNSLAPHIQKTSIIKYFEIVLIGNLLFHIDKGRYYFQARWKTFKLL